MFRLPDRFEAFLLIVALGVTLYAIRDNQLSPHRLTIRLGTKTICERWVTNNLEVAPYVETFVSTNGLDHRQILRTNVLWHVWSIFK